MTPATFRAIRTAAGLTQAELAAHLGLSDGRTVRRYESGARPIPGPVRRLMWGLPADSTAQVTPTA